MVVVVFEVTMKEGRRQEYFDIAARLKEQLIEVEGFISVERFESLVTQGKYVSISFWEDEEAVRRWRDHVQHRWAQQHGLDNVFTDFRISVATIDRHYTLADRASDGERNEVGR
jgi:heme-degrading monooxygenase HmoA